MKIFLQFKTPDVVERELENFEGISPIESEKLQRAIKRFVGCGEYVSIEIDSDTMTARVCER